jgi:hypothetical protein
LQGCLATAPLTARLKIKRVRTRRFITLLRGYGRSYPLAGGHDYQHFGRSPWVTSLSHRSMSCCAAPSSPYLCFRSHNLTTYLVLVVVLRGGCSLHFCEQQRPR